MAEQTNHLEKISDTGLETLKHGMEVCRRRLETITGRGLTKEEVDEYRAVNATLSAIDLEYIRRTGNLPGERLRPDPLEVATEFVMQNQRLDLLEVMQSDSAVMLAKYLHDRSNAELAVLSTKGQLFTELADKILKARQISTGIDPRDAVKIIDQDEEEYGEDYYTQLKRELAAEAAQSEYGMEDDR